MPAQSSDRSSPAPVECAHVLEREPLLRALFDHAPLAQLIGAADGTIERINPAFTSLLGYAPQEIEGRSVMEITHPDDVAKSWASSRRVGLSLPRLSFQKRYLHKNGRAISTLVTLSAVETAGRRCIIAQIVDLTAIKQAHSEARLAHERLQSAIEAAHAGAWEIDFATGHLEWDEALRRRLGLADHVSTPSLDEWIASVHEDDRPSVAAALRNATMPGHGRFDHEMRFRTPGGQFRWYRGVGRVRFDEQGRAMRASGIAIDITDAKQTQLDRERMQAALHRAERRLAAIVANSRDAIIGTTLDLRVMTWSGAAETMFGYTEAEAIGMPVANLIAEWRRPLIAGHVASLQTGKSLPALQSPCVRKDGTVLDAEINLAPVPGDDGKVSWYSGIVRDISDRKRVERRLRDQQRRLESIAQTVDQVFWTTDPKIERMLYVSPGYERIWGRSCASLYAEPKSFVEAIHPDDRAAVLAGLQTHQAGDDFEAEYRVVRPDGSIRRVWDKGHPVRDAAGVVTHYVGVAVDITDRAQEQRGQPPR